MLKRRLLLILSLVLSYVLAATLNGTVFLANTPKVRPNLDQYLIAQAASVVYNTNFINQDEPVLAYNPNEQVNKLYRRLGGVPFRRLGQGVYYAKNNNITVVEYDVDELDWIEYTYEIDGKMYKFRVPKEMPPTVNK
jgi:hypothetical protein